MKILDKIDLYLDESGQEDNHTWKASGAWKSESVDESRINWNKTAYQYSHGKFPSAVKDSGLWMFKINGEQVQYQGKWAQAKKSVENEAKLRLAKGVYGKNGRVDIEVMP